MEGSSWAAGHAAGVAALIVSQFGRRDGASGWTLDPDVVERVLLNTASAQPCPTPPLQEYESVGRPSEFNALCEGDRRFNGFYGHGIVNAFRALTLGALWVR